MAAVRPLFLYIAWQNTHSPLYEEPELYDTAGIEFTMRRTAAGMTAALDDGIANVTMALKVAGLWADTLVLFSADNGGPTWWAGEHCHMVRLALRLFHPPRRDFCFSPSTIARSALISHR